MRRKIALLANGWSHECLMEVGYGIQSIANSKDIDIFAFINHVAVANPDPWRIGEFNIFTIPELKDFDGAVVLGNSFNTTLESDFAIEEINKAGIPAVCVEAKMPGMDYFGSDDYFGMSEITEHLIKVHNVKDILYIGGIEGHEGDNIRKKAVIETAEKYGISIPKDNFLVGEFASAKAVKELTLWRKNHTLPEAIICANDLMAIGVCNYLKEDKIDVPGEVKVTGFDCLRAAGDNEPSITSVNREWLSMGKKIMENLLLRMGGKEAESEVIIGSKMVVGESCGCTLSNEELYNWNKIREKNKERDFNGLRIDQHFRHMFNSMKKLVDKEGMNKALSEFFVTESWVEGNDVMLALVPDFFEFSEITEENKITYGFPEVMDAVSFISNGVPQDMRRAKTSKLIYELSHRNSKAGTYIFAPIRNDLEMYGFVAMSKGFSIVQNDIIYIWTKHMSQYLDLVKSNIAINHLTKRLEALSVTDGLTGVLNRAGCETIIYPKILEEQEKGGHPIVMLADVDRLKKINDKFGHGAGDIAISSSISFLKDILPDESLIGRFGGDEFLISVFGESRIDVDKMAENLMSKVCQNSSKMKLPYGISLSIGAIQLEPDDRFNIKEKLPLMDDKVYKIKEIHHKMEDEEENCS